MATKDKTAQLAVASNMPGYVVAEFKNDAGVAIRVQWRQNGADKYRDIGVGETGVVELVFSEGDSTKKEVKFAATRKDNGEAVLLNGGKEVSFMATKDKTAQLAVASNMPGYVVAEFKNDAGVAIRVQWRQNGADKYRDIGVGETGVVELVFSEGDSTKKEVKFAATRKDNGEAVLLNGGKEVSFMATKDKTAQLAVASNMPGYVVAEFKNDAGVAIRVQWRQNGADKYRDIGVGETGVVELVFSEGDSTKKEVKFAATRKDNGEAVLLNGGKEVSFMATKDKTAQLAVASNMPGYVVAEFKNDAGVAIRVQWRQNGADKYRDIGVGETGVVELVFSEGDSTKKEVKFAATRKDNGEAVLLNGGKEVSFMATKDKTAQLAVASNMPGYVVAEFKNDAGVAIRVQWRQNGADKYRDIGVGETGVVELVFSEGDSTKKEVKFAATRKDNGEAVLLNGGKEVSFMATKDKTAQLAVASNMPGYVVAEFKNDAGVAIRVQWRQNGADKYRDIGVGETGVVELVFSEGDSTKKEVKFAATRKDNGEAVLLNGGKEVSFMATKDKTAQLAVASNMPGYVVAEFKNDAGVAIRVQWRQNGADKYRDIGVGETGVVELVFSEGDSTKKEVKFAATRKDNGEAVLLNGGKEVSFMATKDKTAQLAVASNMPGYVVAEFKNDAGVAIRVQWRQNGADKYRDIGVGETGVVELVFSEGDSTKKEVKFAATRKDNGEAVLLNGGKEVSFMATKDKTAQLAVASNMPGYVVAEFKNDAGVAIRVQWRQNGADKYRDIGVGETGVVELVFSEGDSTKKEVKFAATRKDNGEAVLLNGGKEVSFMATKDKTAQLAVASNMPGYVVAEFKNDAGVAIRVQWRQNGADKYRDIGVGETGVVELVFSEGDSTKKEVKFAATRKDNGEAVLLNGGKEVSFMATKDKTAQLAVASNMPGYVVAEFKNDAGVAIRVQWRQNGADKYRDIGVGETGVVELVFSEGDSTKKEVKFAATRKDNGEAVLLNGGKEVSFMATKDKTAQLAVASNMPGYVVAEFKNDAGVAIRVQWRQNGADKYRDIGVGETGVVELVFSEGDSTKKEVKFAATRKDNGEAVLLNGGKEVSFMATKDKTAQLAVASNMPGYVVAEFKNDAGVAIRVQWRQNGADKYRDIGVGETGVVELVFSEGDSTKKEVKFAATRKDNGEAVLLNGGKEVSFMATKDKTAQLAVASNMPGYVVAEFKNDAGVAIRVQWRQNGADKYRDIGVGETGVVELVFSEGDSTKKEVKFAATRKDNGEAVLLNGGKEVSFMATKDKTAQLAVASNMPGYVVAEFKNDAGVAIRVQWRQNGADKYRDIGVGETGVVELVFSEGDSTKKEVKFAATRKDNGEAVLLNGGKEVSFMATKDKTAQLAVASNMPGYVVAEFKNDAGVAIRVQWRQNGADKYRDIGVGETGVVDLVFPVYSLASDVSFSAMSLSGSIVRPLLDGKSSLKLAVEHFRLTKRIIIHHPSMFCSVSIINFVSGPVFLNWKYGSAFSILSIDPFGKSSFLVNKVLLGSFNVSFVASRADTNEVVLLNGRRSLEFTSSDLGSSLEIKVTDLPRYIIADIANNADGIIVVKWVENSVDKSLEVQPDRSFLLEIVCSIANQCHPITFTATRKDTKEPVNLNSTSSVTLVPSVQQGVYEVVATDVPKVIDLKVINNVNGPVVLLWILKEQPMAINVAEGSTFYYNVTLTGLDARGKVEFTARRTDYDLPVSLNKMDKVEIMPRIGGIKHTILISDKWLVVPWIDHRVENEVPSGTKRHLLVELFTEVSGPFSLNIAHRGQRKTVPVALDSHSRIALIFEGPDSDEPVKFTGRRTDVDFPVQLNYKADVSFVPKVSRALNKIIVSDERIVVPWIEPLMDDTPQIGKISDLVKPMYVMIDFVNRAAGPVVITAFRHKKVSDIELPFGETAKLSIALKGNPSLIPMAFTGKRRDTDEVVSFNYFLKALYIPRKEKVVETVIVRDPNKYITLTFINKAAGYVKVAWILKGTEYSLILMPDDTKRKEILLDGNDSIDYVVFTAIRTLNAAPVLLNGLNSITFKPKLERISQRVVATDAAKYIIVDLINGAKQPVLFQWSEGSSVKSKLVDIGKIEREVITFSEPFRKDRFHFTAKSKQTGRAVSVNNGVFAEVLPSYEKIITKITARDMIVDSKLRYLDITFRNKAPGRIELSWFEDHSQRSVHIGMGETLRKSFSFRGPIYKPLTFISQFLDNQGVIYLNGAPLISMEPSETLAREYVTATSPHVFLKFTNIAPGTAYTEWYNGGTLEKATVIGGGTLSKLVLFNRPGDEIILSGNISSRTEHAMALYNGGKWLQVTEDPQALKRDIAISMGKFELIVIV